MTRTKFSVRRLPKNENLRAAVGAGGWILSGTGIGRFASAAALLLAAAHVGTNSFGALSLALSTTFTITSFSALGLPVAATKLISESWSRERNTAHALMKATFWLTLLAGTTAALAFSAVASLIATYVLERPDLLALLLVAAPLILVSPLGEVFASFLSGVEEFRLLGIYRAVRGGIYGGFVCVTLFLQPSAIKVLIAIVAAESTSCVIGWAIIRWHPKRFWGHVTSRTQVLQAAHPLLRVALPAILASVSLMLALWLAQVLLSRQSDGLEQVGIFAVAYRWHVLALFIPATMGSVLLPMLGRLKSTGHHSDAYALFLQYGGLTMMLTVPAAVVLALLSGPIMSLQGSDYAVGAPVLAVLSLAVVPASLNNVFSQMALAEGRIALWVWSDLALSAVLLACAAAAIPSLGAVGLAWACLAAYVATCLVLLPVLRPSHGAVVAP